MKTTAEGMEQQQCTSGRESARDAEALRRENDYLRKRLQQKNEYIRDKINQLLDVMGTKPLRVEELDDDTLLELDPLGIVFESIRHVLANLKETNGELHLVNEEMTAIFAAAEVGIMVVDNRMRIHSYNNKMKELFSLDKERSFVGDACYDMVCQQSEPDEGCACEMVLTGKEIARVRNWQIHDRIVDVVATPIKGQDGAINYIVVVYNDITDLKQSEEQLGKLNAELEQRVVDRTAQLQDANNELESFCYSVSHDLRAPLRHINGFASILTENCIDSLDDLGRDCLDRICAASSHMGRLIDDLLRLSRVSRATMRFGAVDLSQCAQAAVALYRDAEPERRVRVIIADNLRARGDASLLDIMFQNLIGNAWKYSSRSDEAVIEVGRGENRGQAVFFVRDNGVGFDMAYSDKLFRVFERLHGSDFEGTGIGLATVHRIVTRHRGEIWAESGVGAGATFYFTLPEP